MICKNLAYWVFTSGEEGVHGLDWGIKHASKSFADRYKLDSRYRSLLKAFRLLPSLERPRKGAGLILLPWQGGGKDRDEGALMGFIFSGNDHKGRPNISTVACVVPADVTRALSLSEVIRVLWSSNDLERIARRNSVRPDTLCLDEKAPLGTELPLPIPPSLKWPGKDVGYLMMDGRVRDLRGFCPPLCPPAEEAAEKRKRRTPQLAALLMALALTFGGACCWGSIRDFFQKYLIQPVCSWWSGEDASPSTNSSEDPETTERKEKRRKKQEAIIDILYKNRGKDYLKGLAGLLWTPEPWREKVPSTALTGAEGIPEGFIAKLSNKKWLVEKGDKGGPGGQEEKLINVSVFKEKFKNVLSSHDQYFSSSTDEGYYFSKVVNREDWGKINGLQEAFKNTIKDSGVSPETATHTIAEDKSKLEERLDELLEKTESPENQRYGFGHLSFFYSSEEVGYQVLTLGAMDPIEDEELSKYFFVQKSVNWRRIDVSALEKRLDGTLQKKPYIKFDDERRDITFFLGSKSNHERGGNFKEFLGVFLDDLLESVSVEE